MSKDKSNPTVEWGFYSVTPRIVRTQYKQLSHTEKWLYVCLRDLCGEKGTCFRALRTLAEETDLSIGNLSTGIRHLHEAGLIHAEKKRRSASPTAKEVWHISIVDIWQANVEYCSKNEHPDENVQILNNNVQNMNEPPLERSNTEQQCSNFDDRRITRKNNNAEERTGEEDISDAAIAHRALPDFYLSAKETDHGTGVDEMVTQAEPIRIATSEVVATATRNGDNTREYSNSPDVRDLPLSRGAEPEPAHPGISSCQHAQQQGEVSQIAQIPSLPVVESAGMPPSDQPTPTPDEHNLQKAEILHKTTKRGGKPKEMKPPVEYKADKADVRALILQGRRGQALCEKGEIIQENIAINALAIAYTLEQLQDIHKYLQTRDKFYSQLANKFRIGGVAMAKNAPSVLCILELEQSGEESTNSNDSRHVISSFSTPGYDFASDGFYPSEAERREQYATANW